MRKLQGTWLDNYLRYTKDDETHIHFRYWCGVALISSIVKNKIFFCRGKIKIFPNQYIVLTGPPGCGKGAAINPSVSLGKKTDIPHYLADRMTPEGIIDKLDKGFTGITINSTGFMPVQEKSATIVSTELSTLLNGSDWIYSFLCDTWDRNEYEYTTKSKGQYHLKNMCIGLLGGCTPDYIRKINKDGMGQITGGYTSRNIYAFANGKAVPKAWPDPIDKSLEDDLIDDLKYIAKFNGEFKFDNQAQKEFENWYQDFYDEKKYNEFESEVTQNFRTRVWSHAIKLAICLSVSEADNMLITLKIWNEAKQKVLDVLRDLDVVFRGVGESPLAEAQDRVLRYIEKKGLASYSEILKFNHKHITAEDLDRVLKVLQYAGFIKEDVSGSKLMYMHLGAKIKGVSP